MSKRVFLRSISEEQKDQAVEGLTKLLSLLQDSPVSEGWKFDWSYVEIRRDEKGEQEFVDYEADFFETLSEMKTSILENEPDGEYSLDLFDVTDEDNMEVVTSISVMKKDGQLIIE